MAFVTISSTAPCSLAQSPSAAVSHRLCTFTRPTVFRASQFVPANLFNANTMQQYADANGSTVVITTKPGVSTRGDKAAKVLQTDSVNMSVALPDTIPQTSKAVLNTLLAENESYVSGADTLFSDLPTERARLSSGQSPVAAVVACADSRVAPEIIFRQSLGQLFVVRAAGNVVWGPEVLGSLEYAVEHLKVPLVIVLGHSKCGAVGAACSGATLPGALGAHIENIAKGIMKTGGMTEDVGEAVVQNVKCAVEELRKEESVIAKAEKNGDVYIAGAVYDIESGKVDLV